MLQELQKHRNHIIQYTKLYSGSFSCIVQYNQCNWYKFSTLQFYAKMWYFHQAGDCKVMCIITGVETYRTFMAPPFWRPTRTYLSNMNGCMINLKPKLFVFWLCYARVCVCVCGRGKTNCLTKAEKHCVAFSMTNFIKQYGTVCL
jgi:hypothetical protein